MGNGGAGRGAINKVLVVNRGEIARRVIRGARSLGIATAVVFSDADAAAVWVLEADEAVRLDGTLAADTYLAIDVLLEAAARVGADAIHPGYGFLSENAAFAAACAGAGLTFIGPPAEAIARMGDKLGAKEIMAAHGVPVLRGVTDATMDADAILELVGLPAIIKASAGGGGRGMRIVERAADLAGALESARRESQAAFGDPTVFIERYVAPARHIEVQVAVDAHGAVATLFERECSIQRRHQKVVEEAPSPVVDDILRAQLLAAAAKAATAVDYLGVGTVEFVLAADGTFAFLEMNTRLQVEHPVTEAVTGIDLVRLQFKIAAGEHLGPEVLAPTLRGHAIEVRLCAEDPAAGYLPVSGTFSLFEIDDARVRVDSGVTSGSEVSPFYDSMVAKVIAWGETRQEAAAVLADALRRARIHGLATNRDLLVNVLTSSEFLAGDTTTDFLERVPGMAAARTGRDAHLQHALVAAAALQHADLGRRSVQPAVPAGWRNNRSSLERVVLTLASPGAAPVASGVPGASGASGASGGELIVVGYDSAGWGGRVEVGGELAEVEVHQVTPTWVDATTSGVRRRFDVAVVGDRVLVDSSLGASDFACTGRFPLTEQGAPPGALIAPMPGRVIRTLVTEGQAVAAGEALLVLEAMKMEHTICSPTTGTVAALNVAEGDQVDRGAVLVAVDVVDVA